jgi:general secretion pathway protein M
VTIQLSDRQQKWLAVGLLLLAIAAVVCAFAVPTWWANRRYGDHLIDMQDKLVRYSRIAAMKPAAEQALDRVQKANPQRFYLKGGSPTIAAAELQTLVTKMVEARNGKVVSSQSLPQKDDAKSAAGYSKVSVSVQLTAAITPLQLILHGIETSEPSLFVDQMSIRSQFGRGYKLVPGFQPEFTVQLTIHGYALTAGGER